MEDSAAVGHQLPVAVTAKFLVPGGIDWPVFGDQVDRGNFRTRPSADAGRTFRNRPFDAAPMAFAQG